jgi:hypothetical protein
MCVRVLALDENLQRAHQKLSLEEKPALRFVAEASSPPGQRREARTTHPLAEPDVVR